MNSRLFAGVFAGALLSAVSAPAMATAPVGDPLAGLQAMRELNAIVLGDTQGWLAVQGKTHIGGNLTSGGVFGEGNSSQGAAASTRATLTVGGNVAAYTDLKNGPNGVSGTVGNPGASLLVGGNAGNLNLGVGGSTARIAGTVSNSAGSAGTTITAGGAGSGWLNSNGGSIVTNSGSAYASGITGSVNAETAKLDADLKALSLALASHGTTAGNSIVNNYGALTLNAVADANGVSVFTLSEADLNAWNFKLNVADPTTTVIFNVLGDGSYNWNSHLDGAFGTGFADNVIWNFSDATSVNINQQVFGSILAPWAQVGANSLVTGTVAAKGLRANSGVAMGGVNGADLYFGDAGAVPEPATWAMLIAGFGLVGAAMRRRRSGAIRSTLA